MQTVTADFVKGKKVLLRLDTDVPIKDGYVIEEFRLKAGLETLKLCLTHAESIVIMGHVGRPNGKEDPQFSIKPVVEWLEKHFSSLELPKGKLHILENLRFDKREEEADLSFAKELAELGDVFVNESFAAHHKAASTTVLPTLLPHAAGLQFTKEVEQISGLKNNPVRPQVAIIGGVKIDDKYPAVQALSKTADWVLVGGLLAKNIKDQNKVVAENVLLGGISVTGIDMDTNTIDLWIDLIRKAKQVIWVGPVGKYEDPLGNRGNRYLAEAIIDSGCDSIIGGGDTTGALSKLGMLEKFSFVSTGGGAMLKLLLEGTLPTIEALN